MNLGGRQGCFGGNHEPYYELSGSRRFQLLSGQERPHVNLTLVILRESEWYLMSVDDFLL